MSYSRLIKWDIIPKTLPEVIRNCPKCGNHATYMNTKKFRVNANKNNLDIWLIYQCKQCKSTWNMAIYERVDRKEMDLIRYERFLNNDSDLAGQYGFDKAAYNNKVKLEYSHVEYEILGEDIPINHNPLGKIEIIKVNITCKYSFDLRLDQVLRKKLSISSATLKKLYKDSVIWSEDGIEPQISKKKLKENTIIFIRIPEI